MRKIKAWMYSTYPVGKCLYLYQRKGKTTLINDGRVMGFRRRQDRSYQIGGLLLWMIAIIALILMLVLIFWAAG